jgi:hypothetical protein
VVLEAVTAIVILAEPVRLHHGAHRAVENHNSLFQYAFELGDLTHRSP